MAAVLFRFKFGRQGLLFNFSQVKMAHVTKLYRLGKPLYIHKAMQQKLSHIITNNLIKAYWKLKTQFTHLRVRFRLKFVHSWRVP